MKAELDVGSEEWLAWLLEVSEGRAPVQLQDEVLAAAVHELVFLVRTGRCLNDEWAGKLQAKDAVIAWQAGELRRRADEIERLERIVAHESAVSEALRNEVERLSDRIKEAHPWEREAASLAKERNSLRAQLSVVTKIMETVIAMEGRGIEWYRCRAREALEAIRGQ